MNEIPIAIDASKPTEFKIPRVEDFWLDGFTMRETQRVAIEWMIQNIDKKYLIMQIPVGGGKSLLGMALSRMLDPNGRGDSFLLTPQIILQKQYLESFVNFDTKTLYGKSNYSCSEKKTTCDVGSQMRPKCAACPHRIATDEAHKSPNVVLNNKLALINYAFLRGTPSGFKKRILAVVDECHSIEAHLAEFDSIEIDMMTCSKTYGIDWDDSVKDPIDVLLWYQQSFIPEMYRIQRSMRHDVEEIKTTGATCPDDREKLKLFDSVSNVIAQYVYISQPFNHFESEMDILDFLESYIFVGSKVKRQFKSRTAQRAFKKVLDPSAEKFLFMSSTIIDCDKFCSDLGIDPSEVAFFDIDSEFPVKNRMILQIPTTKMNYEWEKREETKNKMLSNVLKVLELHKNESGIVHTGSFKISTWLVDELQSLTSHRIFHHNPTSKMKRDKVIAAYQQCSKPSILISPSCTEGLDLKDDLGRFAIFAKVPFPYLGDQWIKARFDKDKEWYTRQAVINMIQGGGRIVRTKEDYGTVYILDDCFDQLMHFSRDKFPKWWLESFVKLSDF